MALNKSRLAWELLGLGTGGGELEKLEISFEGGAEPIAALFNPNEINLSRSINWHQRRVASKGGLWAWADRQQEFRSVEAETLAIELFFDSYEARSGASISEHLQVALIPTNPLQKPAATDVRKYTAQVAKLAEVNKELHRPPICKLQWGKFDIFAGVLTELTQKFTLFLADGTPVRATLSCRFAEYLTEAHFKARELHSADVTKARVARRNDTLHSLAAEEYDDPALWRPIARANGIVNPRSVKPGTVLIIPKLPS